MGEAILALLGGALFTPLAVAYVLALVVALILLIRESCRPPRTPPAHRE